jgi:putative oxidoreductase
MIDGGIDAQRLYFPALAGVYRRFAPFSYAFIRFCTGAVLVPHGVQKLLLGNMTVVLKDVTEVGLWPPVAWAYLVGAVELFGAAMLALGLFTRVAAVAIAIEMAVICIVFLWPSYFWTARGMEYALLMGLSCIAFAVRGGGRYSLDRLIGKEL